MNSRKSAWLRSNTYERTVLNSAAFGYYPDFLIIGTELTDQGELYRAACAAMQLLQDRQQHTHSRICLTRTSVECSRCSARCYKSRARRPRKEEEAYGSRGEGLRGLRRSA